MKTIVIATVLLAFGCKRHADPRLAGTWDLVIKDPQYPPSVGAFAHVQSGTFEFGDVNATRTLEIETDDHEHHTVVTRFLDWHIDDDKGWFAYTKDDANHGDEEVQMQLKGDDVSIFDMDTLGSFDFHRRKPATAP